jgi:sugar/nucleoside kinase (ribokinase family)
MFIRIDTPHKIDGLSINNLNLDYDIIVISDYNKGFLDENAIFAITEKHPSVFLDTKKVVGDWARLCKFIKINEYEFNRSKQNLSHHLKNKIIHTLGGRGSSFNGKLYPVENVDVKDSSGAGDAFFAALVVKYSQTNDIDQSIRFANSCASRVVMEKGVTTICPE